MQYETKITHAGIQKHFKKTDPTEAIIELAWNGFDAKADNVDIKLLRIEELGGLEGVTILDNGIGIDIDKIRENFGHFNDSSKKDNIEQHGSRGRGRLAFHKLSNQAIWYTKNNIGKQAKIEINSTNLQAFLYDEVDNKSQHALLTQQTTGTCVELKNIINGISIDDNALINALSIEFGWFLALKPSKKLKLDSHLIKAPAHELFTHKVNIDGYDFEIKIFRWENKPTGEKSFIYLVDSEDRIVNKKFSSFNRKTGFYISTYISSTWADNFSNEQDDLLTERQTYNLLSPTWKAVETECIRFTQHIYDNFLKKFVDEKIEQLEKNGVFPEYKDILDVEQREWRKQNTKQLVRELYLVDPQIFNGLKQKQQKIIIQLLDKLSISNENDALISILKNVLDLDQESMQKFEQQLSKSKLEHIISTIEILQRRDDVIHKLREIMNVHYKEVLETPDLQGIIENNTWLFGNSYEMIGAEEDTFTKIAYNFRNQISGINNILREELDDDISDEELEGAKRQVDLFLARKIPCTLPSGERFFRCIIIEIKKPSISLTDKHLNQLDEYASILQRHPEFSSESLRFELILVGRKISSSAFAIRNRINSLKDKLEPGLVTNDNRFKCYVKNWYTLFDEFKLINGYLLDNLKTKRENLGNFITKELVEDLQKKSE